MLGPLGGNDDKKNYTPFTVGLRKGPRLKQLPNLPILLIKERNMFGFREFTC